MSGYSESSLEKKLSDLNNSAQSIQQLSLWLIHHRKHYHSIVKTWFQFLGKSPTNRKLTFLYLANDVVQNSKKKHPEISKAFGGVMVKVVEHLAFIKELDSKTVKAVGRLLSIWQDRSIFDQKVQSEMSKIWTQKNLEMDAKNSEETQPPPMKKTKSESIAGRRSSESSSNRTTSQQIKEILNSSPAGSPSNADPPETEELIKAIQDLELAASSDAAVREKISRLPPEVSEPSHLSKLESVEEGQELLVKVNQAMTLLTDYNERLQQELVDRKKLDKMMVDFLAAQKDLLAQAEERLELYRDKLDRVNAVRDDLKSHIQSLPDLTKLPDVTGGLPPLPSAGDLFTAR